MRHLIDPLDFTQQEITTLLDLADLRGGCPCALRRSRRTLDAGVHVRAIVVADIHNILAALHRARQRLKTDVVRTAVATERNELDLAISRDLARTLEALVSSLDTRDGSASIRERIVNERNVPCVIREDGGGNFQATRSACAYYVVIVRAHEHLANRHGCAATAAKTMTWSQLIGASR